MPRRTPNRDAFQLAIAKLGTPHSKSVRSLKRGDDVAAWASCHSCRVPMVMRIRILQICVRAMRI
jgi:hypothetical protein